MSALLVALLLAQDVPPSDRPLVIKAGMTVPWDGVLLSDAKTVETGRRVAACEASLAVAETKVMVSAPVVVGAAVAVAAVVAGAFAVGFAVGAKRP